jgi:polyisoprenoid-binding protein YceI
MQKHRLVAGFTLASVALAATAAMSAPTQFSLDAAHTSAEFKVRHIFTKVPGRFSKVEGRILLDEKNLANSSVEATIPAGSVFTDNEKRDNHLKSQDFFWVEKHPNITFKSKKIVPGEGDAFQIVGDLTIRGVTKEVTLDAAKLGVVDAGPMMGTRAGFEATTTINRKDFGIVWNMNLDKGGVVLGDEVEIALNVEAVHKPEAEAAKAE